ncbi:NACHT domain-containing NTPase [Leptolyngbya sp. FACHB-17]|uniref:NACHT domain-containing protein n=1 Tax=unclassified Leptolyngbya TaxID=2650499 RepID=UPI0016803B4A|nr:NACHT domain-containing NTPase [Leptolyngbya sp. FACHB-17]MBD2080418.1 NACHT domain-containing NTPase [Leptolyngbya sp. FACHB-17]
MAKRSFQATEAGIKQAKSAFDRTGWTQEGLAMEVNLRTRQPVWRFFTGRPVERHIFIELCSALGLDWQDIAEHSAIARSEPKQADETPPEMESLVRQVRVQRQDKVQNQCGTLQLLNVSRPIKIDDLYIDVNILEEIVSQQWLGISDLQNFTSKDFDRFGLGEMSQTQTEGTRAVETYSKLRVLGKPGAGKTTFLQHLAIQCNRGRFAANRIPIFITLRDFADESRAMDEFSLIHYIREEFLTSGISDSDVVEALLRSGKMLLLLDGLDECGQDSKAVVKEIRRFSENYQQNLFVVTCRTAAKSLSLNRFTDVEIAPFTQAQIAAFGQKWFEAFTKITPQEGREQAGQFIEKLNLSENLPFRQLAATPLFLHLACWMFQYQHQFPSQRSEFYRQCIDILLSKWDEAKGFEREELYQGFSLPQKLKLLSQIAAITFEQGKCFFEQHSIKEYISDYLRDLPTASMILEENRSTIASQFPGGEIELEELQIESEGILKAIELQHGLLTERVRGIFSFSDLAFQEYFTARKIVANYNLQATEQPLDRLVSHITDPRWREVFLLTAAMLRSADPLVLLMKRQIDALVAQDQDVQKFLGWAHQKSLAAPPSPTAIRAFHHALTHQPQLVPLLALSSTLDQGVFLDMALDNLVRKCTMSAKRNAKGADAGNVTYARACVDALDNALILVMDINLHRSLQQLKDQLPDLAKDRKEFQTWWKTSALSWAEQLRAAISEHRNTQHQWNFSPEQQHLLQQYYTANQLLIDCLNTGCAVTAAVRQEIEVTLLLPQKELEDREWQWS